MPKAGFDRTVLHVDLRGHDDAVDDILRALVFNVDFAGDEVSGTVGSDSGGVGHIQKLLSLSHAAEHACTKYPTEYVEGSTL